jgi:hypothetical protein
MAFLAIALYKLVVEIAPNFHKTEKRNPAKLTFLQQVQYQRNTPYTLMYSLMLKLFPARWYLSVIVCGSHVTSLMCQNL